MKTKAVATFKNLFNRAIKGKNNGSNKVDDDGDDYDDDDYDKRYREIEARKKEYKDEGNLDPSVNEEFNKFVRYSKYLEGKTYIIGKVNQFMLLNLITIMKNLQRLH